MCQMTVGLWIPVKKKKALELPLPQKVVPNTAVLPRQTQSPCFTYQSCIPQLDDYF